MTEGGDAVVVTGMGAVTPLGATVEATWRAVLDGASAARRWDDLVAEGFPAAVACRAAVAPALGAGAGERPRPRGEWLALQAAREAAAQADLPASGDDGTLAVLVGTTLGESEAFERAAPHAPPAAAASPAVFTDAVGDALGAAGPRRTYGAACAAGNYAIGEAAELVRAGAVKRAVAGGVEPLSRIALVGFLRSRAMAEERCRPFDRRRDGMLVGEGAAFVVLERWADARARGVRPLAVIEALGLACDADHPTRPRADGSGLRAAIDEALRLARRTAADVGWISAHGTGTAASDQAEARALRDLFGPGGVPVSGLKGGLGHCLGAATAIGVVLAARALDAGVLPPTAGCAQPDPELGLDVVTAVRAAPGLRAALNLGMAFGGLCSALLLTRATELGAG